MTFHAPQLIWLSLAIFGIGIAAGNHGSYKMEKHNVWTTLISSVISFFLLKWGGFFG